MVWKFGTGGIVRSCPSISNEIVYIASDDGFVYAIHAKDGGPAWKTDIGNAYPHEERVNLGTSPSPSGFDYRQSSPVFADGLIYVGSFDGNVYALDANDGKVVWKFKTGAKVRATPTIFNGVVYIGSWDGKSYALEAKTGKPLWYAPVQGQVQSTALVVDGMVITASRKASVQALDLQTGELVWEYSYGPNLWVESSPRLAGDKIIIGSSGSNTILGIDYKTGELAWMFSAGSFTWSTPLPIDDTVYIGGAGFNKQGYSGMFVLQVTNKNLPFNNVKRRVFSVLDTLENSGTISGVAGSPVMADGTLFFGALDGNLYAVKD
jgi:outer membrane protein assembly factor BamB